MSSSESTAAERDLAEPGGILRDESGMISSIAGNGGGENDRPISGPLGIYPFPILNSILSNFGDSSGGNKVVVTEFHRDENGRIEAIEEVKV